VPAAHQVPAAPVFLDQLVDVITAVPAAPRTLDTEHVELALNVSEDEIGSGHGGDPMVRVPVPRQMPVTLVGRRPIFVLSTR